MNKEDRQHENIIDRQHVDIIMKWEIAESYKFMCLSHYFHFRASGKTPPQAWRILISFLHEAYTWASSTE